MTSSDTPGPGGCLRAWGQGVTWDPWGEAREVTWEECIQEEVQGECILEEDQEECILEEDQEVCILEEDQGECIQEEDQGGCIQVWDTQAWDPWEECHQEWEDQ